MGRTDEGKWFFNSVSETEFVKVARLARRMLAQNMPTSDISTALKSYIEGGLNHADYVVTQEWRARLKKLHEQFLLPEDKTYQELIERRAFLNPKKLKKQFFGGRISVEHEIKCSNLEIDMKKLGKANRLKRDGLTGEQQEKLENMCVGITNGVLVAYIGPQK